MEQLFGGLEGVNVAGGRLYVCSFVPNGSSAPTSLKGQGVSSVAYVTGSIWKLTLADSNFTRLLWADARIQAAAGGSGAGFDTEIDATNTSMANGTIAFASLNTSRAREDIAGDANSVVYVSFIVSKNPLDA
jgi:hypothetical protein